MNTNRHLVAALIAALTIAMPAAKAAEAIPDYIQKAVDDPGRVRFMVARDKLVKPAETMAFAGIKPGQVVAELYPDGYFTRMLSKAIGPKGHLYGLTLLQSFAQAAELRHNAVTRGLNGPLFVDRLLEIENMTEYSNFTDLWEAAVGNFGGRIALPEQIDVLWEDHYHDMHDAPVGAPNMVELNRSVFKAMKPGGIYLASDSYAQPGACFSVVETIHRTDPECVKREIMQAGFVFDGESDILRHPNDNYAELEQGSAQAKDADDRYLLRFKKPETAPDTSMRPKPGGPDSMAPYYGNTLMIDDAEPRYIQFDKGGIFHDFGEEGPGRYPLRQGTWFWDAYGDTCMRSQYPWIQRALIVCTDLTHAPSVGQPYTQSLSDGRSAQAELLAGHVRPKGEALPTQTAAAGIPAYIGAAVADNGRPSAQIARDPKMKPAETMAFAGIKPGQVVAELLPDGYYTRLLSKVIGPTGRDYTVVMVPSYYDAADQRERQREGRQVKSRIPPGTPDYEHYWYATGLPPAELAIDHALEIANSADYSNVTVLWEWPKQFGGAVALPQQIDVLWKDHYHDLHEASTGYADVVAVNKSIFRAMKPGGTYVVDDPVAMAGTGFSVAETLHRSDPEAVKKEITDAGFVFDGESNLLRNPSDDHSWVTNKDAVRDNADRFLMRFKKPLNAPATDKRPSAGQTTPYDGNTLVTGEGTGLRHMMYDKSGIYRDFGYDMIPSWAISGIGIEITPVQVYAGKWFYDADGHTCRQQEYPLIYRGLVRCDALPAHARTGDTVNVGESNGTTVQGRLLSGIVFPHGGSIGKEQSEE